MKIMMKNMSLISSIFRAEKSLPKEDMLKEEEEPCTSYSHQGDREISRRKTPSFGEEKEKWDKITKLLPLLQDVAGKRLPTFSPKFLL